MLGNIPTRDGIQRNTNIKFAANNKCSNFVERRKLLTIVKIQLLKSKCFLYVNELAKNNLTAYFI